LYGKVSGLLSAQEQQMAQIGDFKLEPGEVIRDCAIGYRSFGTLNPVRSNAVLFPTAFGWRSSGLATRNSLADFEPSKSKTSESPCDAKPQPFAA
jgi:homoserine acetyltransferase